MNERDKRSGATTGGSGTLPGNEFELTSGAAVPAKAVFLTNFTEPLPKDVKGRVEALFGLFKQIPERWQRYVDLVLAKPDVFTGIYEAVYEGGRKRVRIRPADFDRGSIVKAMKGPLSKALALLPAPPFMIFVFPRFFSSLAVDGHCVFSRTIHLFIDPRGDWRHWLPSTLCHEFFHLAYKNLHAGRHTSAETMVDEALGMHFAEALTGHRYYRKAELSDRRVGAWLRKNRRALENGAYDVYYAKNMQPEGFYCGYALVRPLLRSMAGRPDKWRAIAAMPTNDVFREAWRLFFKVGSK